MTRARDVSNIDGLLTTKGDIYAATGAGVVVRQGVGANGTVLTANSALDDGLEWATPAAGGMTLISTTSLTGATVTLSSIPSTYNNLQLVIRDVLTVNNGTLMNVRINGDSGANRHVLVSPTTANNEATFNATSFTAVANVISNSVTQNIHIMDFYDYANTVTWKYARSQYFGVYSANTALVRHDNYYCIYNQTSAISSINLFLNDGSNFTSGTALLYGVK